MQNMKNVLIIRYPIYPVQGGIAHSLIKFIKYLPNNGWHPIVLTLATNKELTPSTKKAISNHLLTLYRSPLVNPIKSLIDTFFYSKVHSDFPKHQTNKYVHRLIFNLRNWFMIPDALIWWIPFAIHTSITIAKKHDVDIIYTRAPRYSCHIVAEMIKKRLKIPWVADFRDPWLKNPCISYPTPFHRQLNAYLEKKTIISADKVMVGSEPLKRDFMERYPNEPPDKFLVITAGFDTEDFKDITIRKKRKKHKITITHTGTLIGDRNPITFLKALKSLINNNPKIKDELKVLFVGKSYLDIKSMVSNLELDDCVEILPEVSRKKSLQYQLESDILLIIQGIEKALTYPEKIFEYMATGKPILVLDSEDSIIIDLLKRTNSGVFANINDVGEITMILENLYKKIKTGSMSRPDQKIISRYDFRQLTRQLADVFNEVSS